MAYQSSTSQRGWASQLISPWDIGLKEVDWLQLVKKWGGGFDVLNFNNLFGKTLSVGSNEITIIEEGVRERPVTVTVPASAVAPIDPTLTFSSADDSDDYVREGMSLLIPAKYVSGQDYDLELRLYKSGSDWKGKSFSLTATIPAEITAKELILTASSYGEGANGIDPMTGGFYERTTNGRTLKEACAIEGGRQFEEVFQAIKTEYGQMALMSKEQMDASFRLDSQMDAFLLTGNANTNTANLTTTSISGGSNVVRSTKGLVPIMKELAQELTYTTEFDMDSFNAVKALLESVGVMNREVDFLGGTDLLAGIESANIDWLDTNSAGHSFYQYMNEVGFMVKQVVKNSVRFNLMELHSFANINKFGAAEYGYRNMGFIFPKGERNVTLQGAGTTNEKLKLPHFTLGYANNQGENRTRMVHAVNGNTNLVPGALAANSWDGVKFDFATHVVPIFNYMQQTILVTNTANVYAGA